jgi:hypothetical protein
MSYFYGIPGLQAVTDADNVTNTGVTFNNTVLCNLDFVSTSTSQFSGYAFFNSDSFCYFGDGLENGIRSRGVDLYLDTISSGAGGICIVGDGSSYGSLKAGTLGLGDSFPSGNTPLLSMDNISAVVAGAISSTIEHTGSTSTMRAMLMTAIHNGNANNQNAVGGYFSGQIKVKNSGTAQIFGVNGLAQLNGTIAISTGTTNLQNKFEVTGAGGTHTGGIVYSRSVWATEPTNLTGLATFERWAGLFSGDLQVNSDKKLLLEGTDTVKGDTYLIYDSAATELDIYVNGVNTVGTTATQINLNVDTQAKAITCTQGTPGSTVFCIQTTTTNDDPTVKYRQNRIETTNGTITAIDTIPTVTDTCIMVDAQVVARRTGGTAGTAGDIAAYGRRAAFKNVGGVLTQIGTTQAIGTFESQAGWDCTIVASGTNILVRGLGAANNNTTWHSTTAIYQLGT